MISVISSKPAALFWPPRPFPGAIAPGEVHLWAWGFGGGGSPSEEDLQLLDAYERQRTARYHFPADRVRYSVCHANMRRVLAGYLNKPPALLTFDEGAGGKPELACETSDAPLRFSLSHSKTIAVLAVARGIEVGMDVEDIRPIEREVAKRFFSAAEVESLSTLEGLEWLGGFYRCWTRKEAILKAEGLGLTVSLDSFDVSVLAQQPAKLLAARPTAKLTADWQLHHLHPAQDTIGALAVGSASVELHTYALQTDS